MDYPQKRRCYVAHFDMLGFKGAINRNPDVAWVALNNLKECMEKILSKDIEVTATKEIIGDRVVPDIFSDTILIFTSGDEPIDLISILVLTSELYKDALSKCVPLRGGISYGDFFVSPDLKICCGIPFVRAYELGEMAQWTGIVLDDIVADHYNNLDDPNLNLMVEDKPTIIQWDVPTKLNGMKKLWVIAWPLVYKNNFTVDLPITVQDYYQAFEPLFGPYVELPDNVKAIYENSVYFINTMLPNEVEGS